MQEIMVIILVSILSSSMLVYFISVIRLIIKSKKDTDFWESIGSPSVSSPDGQFVIISTLIFGKNLPDRIKSNLGLNLLIVRISLFLGVFFFMILFIHMFLEEYK